jgi:hypothetical protein
LIWQGNRPDHQMTREKWLKFVNRVATNKIKIFRRNQIKITVPLSETNEELCLLTKPQTNQHKGNMIMELHLLVSQMWAVIQGQTFLNITPCF